MLDRLERIEAGTLEATDYDRRFFTHEIRELQRYRAAGYADGVDAGGDVWNDIHTATLEDFQMADWVDRTSGDHSLYHPDSVALMD